MISRETKLWYEFTEDERELMLYCLPFEDLRRQVLHPYSPGMFRWFRSPNVLDLERYRRHRARRAVNTAPRGGNAA
jgi:hypothetical protein